MSGLDPLLDGGDFDFGDDLGPDGASWSDVTRLADALEHAVGLNFRGAPALPPDATTVQLGNLVKRLDDESYDAIWDWRRQWRLNEAFYRGEFTAYWNDVTRCLDYDTIGPRVHVPIFRPTLSVLEARLNSTKPEMVVTAKSTEQSALDKARAATRAAESQYQEIGVDEFRVEAVHKLLLKGSVFAKLTWDAKGGKSLGMTTIPKRDENGELIPKMQVDMDPDSPTFGEPAPVLDADGIPDWEVETDELGNEIEEEAFEGCNVLSCIDPEDISVDPTITRWRDRMWVMHRYYESPASVEQRLGFTNLKPDGKEQAESPPQSGYGMRPGRKSRRPDSDTVLVRELYIRRGTFPCSDKEDDTVSFPDGWIIVECQGQVKAMPNQYGDGPIYYAKALVGDQQFYGECVANDLRGIQATFTRGMSDWDLQNALTGNPRLFWPEAAGTPDEDTVGTPGARIRVEGMRAEDRPYIMDGKSISVGSEKYIEFIFGDVLGYISGVREGGLAGGVPPNVEAAQALRILGERDATRLASPALGYGLLLRDILRGMVLNLKTFASEERLYAIVGKDQSVEVQEFAGSDLDDDLIYTIVPESIRPQSDEVRRASALQMFQMGLATAGDTRRKVGEIDGADALLETRLIQQCRRERMQALKEHQITTSVQEMKYEDFELAMDCHRADLFDVSMQQDPMAQAVLLAHMDWHVQVNNMMQAGLIPPGGGPPPPGMPGQQNTPGGQPPPGGQQPTDGQPPGPGDPAEGMPQPQFNHTQVGLADQETGSPPSVGR